MRMTRLRPVSIWKSDTARGLADFAEANESDVAAELATCGAILFRGFPQISDAEFKEVLTRFGGPVLEYSERSSPRREISARVYSSTEYPSDQDIFFHNENSYQVAWPKILGFVCREPAESGGETPVADCRSVLERIDHGVLAQFEEHGWSYTRNFYPGLGLPWQEVFGTTDRSEVDEYCQAHALHTEWTGKSALRVTSSRKAALAEHPISGEQVWFNHAAFFHYSTLPAEISETLYAGMAAENLPSNSYFGNGESISPESMELIRQAYETVSQPVEWALGDVLLIDNMLMAHGRRRFSGSRRISVAMAGLIEAKDVGRMANDDAGGI
jgi:alpha-ketoglutarate-dependent taurine dioxygenase